MLLLQLQRASRANPALQRVANMTMTIKAFSIFDGSEKLGAAERVFTKSLDTSSDIVTTCRAPESCKAAATEALTRLRLPYGTGRNVQRHQVRVSV